MARSLLLTLLVLGNRDSGLRARDPLQDEDGQKNTALVKLYPKIEELVGQADELAKQGNFAAALEIYHEASRSHPNFLVPVEGGRLVGVGQFILDRILSWPKEGQDAYRRRYDPPSLEEFEAARETGDPGALDELVERYPLTSVVDDALMLRASLALDAGDPETAVRALERILAIGSDLPAPVVVARLGLAYSVAGRKADLQRLLRRSEREWPREEVRVGAGSRTLVRWLSDLLARTQAREERSGGLEIPGWEMIGGGPSGSRLAEGQVTLGSSQWKFQVPPASFESDEDERWRRHPSAGPGELYRPLHPAVSDGIVFLHGEYFAAALNLFGGSAAPLWTYRLPQPPGVLMFDDRLLHATTVHDGRVFVNLITALGDGEDQLGYVRVKFPFPKRALFALDAYTGRLLWRLGGKPRTETLEENATFAVPPTPEGDRLYVGAVRQRLSTDPFEHYLLCLDAATGKILWSTFVASGLTEINLFGNSTRESFGTPVSIVGDTLYYGTNHGVFAAVEKKTGRLRWAARYTQLPVLPTRSIYVQKNPLQWMNSPPVVSGGVAVCTPTDSRYLYAFEASSGRRLWRVEREPEMRVLYGAKDDLLVVGGEELFFFEIRTGRCLKTVRPRSPGAGRGALSADAVYMPTRDGLATIRLDTKAESDFRRWSSVRGGGNIVVVDGAVVRSGSDVVEAFYDRRSSDKAVEEVLKRSADDPLLLYRCAIRLAQADRGAEAVALLEKAFARVEGSARADEERLARACRLRLFHLRYELGREALRSRAGTEARDHLVRAVRLAPDTASRVEATLLLAEALEMTQAPEGAIRELYALLEAGDEVVGGVRVSGLVRTRVDELLRKWGRGCFAALEREASEELDRARRAGTPESFLTVLRRFPNSASAETALLEASDAYARLGRPDDEIASLREFLREYPQSKQIAPVHARLVVAFEKRGQFGSAAPLLRRMLRNFPDARVTDGGREVSAREFAETRLASERYRREAGSSEGPVLKPPLRLSFEYSSRTYPEAAPLRVAGTWPASLLDLALLSYGVALEGITSKGRAWAIALESPLRFAAFLEEALLVATENRIRRVNPSTGAEEWAYVSPTPMRGFAMVGGQVCFLTADARGGSGAAGAVDAVRGVLSWTRPFDGYSNSAIHEAGELAVFLTTSPSKLWAIEVETGRDVLAGPLNSGGLGVQVLQVSDRQIVLAATERYLESYELPGGKLQWRVDLRTMGVRVLEPIPGAVFLVGMRAGSNGEVSYAALVDLKSGKVVRLAEGVGLGDARYAVIDDERAMVFSLEGTRREIVVREVRLKDLSLGWTAALGEAGMTLLPPMRSGGAVVVPASDRGENGRFAYSVTVLDRNGKTVQNIRSEFKYERPPRFLVAGGALVVTAEAGAQVYR